MVSSRYRYLNRIISLIKGESYEFDSQIPTSYVIRFFFNKLRMLIRGIWVFQRVRKPIFLGKQSIIKAKYLLVNDGALHIDRMCYIDAMSKLGIVFGCNTSIGKNTTIECTGSLKQIGIGLKVGNHVGLGSHGYWGCAGGITIGDSTIFGNYVSLHSENHNYNDISIDIRNQGVSRLGIVIGRNCWIGAKVTILDGVTINDGCIIAAGSVVVKGVYNSNAIYGGVPARFIKKR